MYKVAVVSENGDRCNDIANAVEEYRLSKKLKISVERFSANLDSVEIDTENISTSNICIIDFYNYNKAVKLIAALYEKRKDLIWICIGASTQLLYQLLLLRPSGYIQDIADNDELCRLLSRILRFQRYNEQNEYFSFKCDGLYIKLPYSSISYFESSAKKVTLHLYNSVKKYYLTAKLDDIQNIVPEHFLRCHQSYLVNMNCIRCFDTKNKVIIALPNEEVLVSRRMYTSSRQIFEDFTKKQRDTYGFIPNIPV